MPKLRQGREWIDQGTYKEPLPSTDNIRVPQLQIDDATTYVDKDGSNNLTLTDAVSGTKTLAQLVAGSHTQNTDTDLDATFEATFVKHVDVDDTPVDGVTTDPVSSNWAYDHVAAADPHAGYVLESLYDAYSILMATTDNTPEAITVAEQTLIGRITSGAIKALTVAEAKTLLAWATDIATHAALTTNVHGVTTDGFKLNSKVVTSTRDMSAASGDVSYTGAGFQPTAVIIRANINSTRITSTAYVDSGKVAAILLTNYDATDNNDHSSTWAVYIVSSEGAGHIQYASVKSYDADGITLTWVKGLDPTLTIQLHFFFMR